MMELATPYFNLTKQEPEAAYGALVEILLKSRVSMQMDAASDGGDEDVNAYLAGVLFEYMDPGYQRAAHACLADRETDVFRQATQDGTAYRRYWVYKVNADDRLMTLGIFHPRRGGADAVLAQTKIYYRFASTFNRRMSRRVTAVSDILEKLACRTERYVSILNQARLDYLSFLEMLSREALRTLQQPLEREAGALTLGARCDELLDLYAEWRRTGRPALKARVLELFEALHRLDPRFAKLNLFHP